VVKSFKFFNYFRVGGFANAKDYFASCPISNCGGYPSAAGSCAQASLSTPEMTEKLNEMSRRAPLLVASCTGGLVPWIIHPPMKARNTNLTGRKHLPPIAEVKGSGE
jgi:hypothetical protein